MQTKAANQVASSVVGAMKSGAQSVMSATPAGRPTSEIADAVNRVFALFQAHWPRKFTSIWPTVDALRVSKRSWALAFRDCRHLTVQTMEIGLMRVRSETWPPDNAGEFLALCHVRPEDIGAPEFDRAFSEAVNQSYPYASWRPWSHRCVYWASIWTGQSDLAERGQAIRKQFDREYQKALDQHDTLAEPPAGRLAVKTYQQSEEERVAAAEQGIANLKQILRGVA